MVRNLRGWAMSPKGMRCLAAVAQLTGVGILIAVLWRWHGRLWAAVAFAVIAFGWGMLVSWRHG